MRPWGSDRWALSQGARHACERKSDRQKKFTLLARKTPRRLISRYVGRTQKAASREVARSTPELPDGACWDDVVAGHLAGDRKRDGVEMIRRELAGRLYSVAQRSVPSDVAADDVLAETFEKITRYAKTIAKARSTTGCSIRAYVVRVFENTLREQIRKARRHRSEELANVHPMADGGPSPDLIAELSDALEYVSSRASSEDWRIFSYSRIKGLSGSEIVSIMALPNEGHVYRAITRVHMLGKEYKDSIKQEPRKRSAGGAQDG